MTGGRLHFTAKEAADALRAIMRRDHAHPQVAKMGELHQDRLVNVQRILDHIGADRPQGVVHMVSGGDDTVCGRFACDETMTTADINMVTCYKCRKESDGSEVPKPKLVKPHVRMIDAHATTVTLGMLQYFVYTGTSSLASLKAHYGLDVEMSTGVLLTTDRVAGVQNALDKLRNEFPTYLAKVRK